MSNFYDSYTYTFPTGYSLLPVNSDIYNNATIANLYNYFSAQLGQRGSLVTANNKEGNATLYDSQTKYLVMALYVLRQYYNGTFNIPLVSADTVISLYWVGNTTTPADLSSSLITNVPLSNYELQTALPSGYTFTLNNSSLLTITTVNPSDRYLYYVITGSSTTTGFSTIDYFPALSYSNMQSIIQKCIQICGNPNFTDAAKIETDNIYVSLGQNIPATISGFTRYKNYY